MAPVSARKGKMLLKLYRGDAKTLLAFNFTDKSAAKDFAGFTIQCQPKGQPAFYIFNNLQFERPADHAQDLKVSPRASINAPIHKFRWVHVPGSIHQGIKPFFGNYTYTVTPRYFDNGKLKPLDPALSASATILVDNFSKGNLELGFTRGYTQSQAFVHHFGHDALIQPKNAGLLFDTAKVSGANAEGVKFTYRDEYGWLGATTREKIFALFDDVLKDKSLVVDVFAYDLNEPDLLQDMLKLAKQGRIRIILDNSSGHHDKQNSKPEDRFEKLFKKAAGKKELMKRGKFNRFAHDKVFIVSKKGKTANSPKYVLTGSTNFSVTGLYVNSNHVLVYRDTKVAQLYAGLFKQVWDEDVKLRPFVTTPLSLETFSSSTKGTPKTDFTFAPHDQTTTTKVLKTITSRIAAEGKKGKTIGSVMFAVMQVDPGKDESKRAKNPVYLALNTLHKDQRIFSFGISDSPGGISLYSIGKKTGVLVTGKPSQTILPPPFDQVPAIKGFGHQVHHKFVVCGFNGDDPVVFCGSSNLSNGGEQNNGDNLLAVRDGDVATVFAIEALLLVDHFDFLDRMPKAGKTRKPPVSKQQQAASAGWFLSTDDKWTAKFFDSKDLHSVDRELFGN
jgi:Phosphatidylserine/phosphatidylglycerophosphate/cardiolipin synthases and related enzymes